MPQCPQFRPLTFYTALSGLRTEYGVVRGPSFVVRHLGVSYASLLDPVVAGSIAERAR